MCTFELGQDVEYLPLPGVFVCVLCWTGRVAERPLYVVTFAQTLIMFISEGYNGQSLFLVTALSMFSL